MPELPEVETVRRGLVGPLEGRLLRQVQQRRADLRWPLPTDFAARLSGRRVLRLGRRAKYLLAEIDSGETWITHLGMSGRMFVQNGGGNGGQVGSHPAPDKHDHIIIDTDADQRIVFQDHRRFGMMDLVASAHLSAHPLLRNLGPEPLGNHFHGEALSAALRGRKSSIKAALLDQRLVAGLGNIYVSEALFQAGISPRRKAGSVAGRRAERLVAAIRSVLLAAIDAGGSSLRDYRQSNGELGYFQHAFNVYGREGMPCPQCGHAISRIVQSGRSTYFCGSCQR